MNILIILFAIIQISLEFLYCENVYSRGFQYLIERYDEMKINAGSRGSFYMNHVVKIVPYELSLVLFYFYEGCPYVYFLYQFDENSSTVSFEEGYNNTKMYRESRSEGYTCNVYVFEDEIVDVLIDFHNQIKRKIFKDFSEFKIYFYSNIFQVNEEKKNDIFRLFDIDSKILSIDSSKQWRLKDCDIGRDIYQKIIGENMELIKKVDELYSTISKLGTEIGEMRKDINELSIMKGEFRFLLVIVLFYVIVFIVDKLYRIIKEGCKKNLKKKLE